MNGTQSHEGIVGTQAAIDYLARIGQVHSLGENRRSNLVAAFETIGAHERTLAASINEVLAELSDVRVWGITDPRRLHERVPTFSFTHRRRSPVEVARHLAARGIFVWHGNFYALPVTEALGLEPEGLVRVGLLHYNTVGEIERLRSALAEL